MGALGHVGGVGRREVGAPVARVAGAGVLHARWGGEGAWMPLGPTGGSQACAASFVGRKEPSLQWADLMQFPVTHLPCVAELRLVERIGRNTQTLGQCRVDLREAPQEQKVPPRALLERSSFNSTRRHVRNPNTTPTRVPNRQGLPPSRLYSAPQPPCDRSEFAPRASSPSSKALVPPQGRVKHCAPGASRGMDGKGTVPMSDCTLATQDLVVFFVR